MVGFISLASTSFVFLYEILKAVGCSFRLLSLHFFVIGEMNDGRNVNEMGMESQYKSGFKITFSSSPEYHYLHGLYLGLGLGLQLFANL